MKFLYVTTIGMTMMFFKDIVKRLIDEGHTVDIACNDSEFPIPECYEDYGCRKFFIPCSRSPLSIGNIKVVTELKRIVSAEKYDIVHCHTPIAAACTRLACRALRKNGTKVYYTAHGFHFYKGSPLKNWMIFYPIEKICARYTDVLITINKEDYNLARERLKSGRIEMVPGVGIETEKYYNTAVDRSSKRAELGIADDSFLVVSVGELNENKNHKVIVRAIAELAGSPGPDVHYAIAGDGGLKQYLSEYATKLGVSDKIHLLGFRNDIAEIYKASDLCCFPSVREGLGLAAIEGMASGLPLLVSDNRGTREYAAEDGADGANAMVCKYDDHKRFADCIDKLRNDKEQCKKMGEKNSVLARNFDVSIVVDSMMKMYGI